MMKYLYILTVLIALGCDSDIIYPDKGYDYPSNVQSSDSCNYFFQLKNTLPISDSFGISNYYRYLFIALKEPNLSVAPLKNTTIRLTYSSVMDRPIVITLTEKEIVLKEGIKGYGSPNFDTSKLDVIEKFNFAFLEKYFPIQETRKIKFTTYFDSITSIHPELLSADYYQSLLDKSLSFGKDSFQYLTTHIPIQRSTFKRIVLGINSSDYWDQPFYTKCKTPSTDGFSYILEMNTPRKYKVIMDGSCSGYTRQFHKAWQELINYAKLNKRLSLIYE